MRLRTINCYLYDSKATALLIRSILSFVQTSNLENIILQKSWVFGFHLKVTLDASNANHQLEELIRRHAARHSRERTEDEYVKYERMVNKLALMEEYSGSFLPLRRDGEVTVEEGNSLSHGNPLCSANVNYSIELLKSRLIADIYESWIGLPADKQNVESAKMFFITGSSSPGGLKVGYLSLRSNFEYFKAQLEGFRKDEATASRIHEALHGRTDTEREFVTHGVQNFTEGRFEREFIFGRLRIFIGSLWTILEQAYERGELVYDKLYYGEDFFERHDQVSSFHQTFFSNSDFLKHYHDKGFVVYRFVAAVLYSLMPMLEISPLRKQRITGLVSESVESGYEMDWKDAYSYLEMKMAGESRNDTLVN
ncbi:hypothetical protein KIH86_06680 [Paenibacillus sp. HN-1]|uniref:hypothetical protein n=1 Tax=Paenibacillus TaxID=44249 RepID=UPI001CAA300E|nr:MULTISPECIES: hypothetical protein [Paenibacillus]MBY9077974.1 hypothetical protein [Paenibacillus sp. CGMCC 1.18879]MBY9083922.1 hypothetical protein [Paenibacillus sinensis]